jgi:hypothetical protein
LKLRAGTSTQERAVDTLGNGAVMRNFGRKTVGGQRWAARQGARGVREARWPLDRPDFLVFKSRSLAPRPARWYICTASPAWGSWKVVNVE